MIKFLKKRKKSSSDTLKSKKTPIKAAFSYYPQKKIKSGEEIRFTNESLKANIFVWNFGDGTITTDENTKQIFSSPGTYQISLIAMSDEGSDSVKKTIMVE